MFIGLLNLIKNFSRSLGVQEKQEANKNSEQDSDDDDFNTPMAAPWLRGSFA